MSKILIFGANVQLLEYSGNYSKKLGSLYQYYKNEPAVDNTGAIVDFPNDNTTDSFKFKENITGQISNNDTKIVQTMVSLNYLANFWKTLEVIVK